MKSLLLVLILSVTAYAFVIKVPTSPSAGKGVGRLEWLSRQKLLLSLFDNVCEDSIDSYIISQASGFTADFGEGNYKNPEVLVRFKDVINKGFLPKDAIFTEMNKDHYSEFLTVRDILINAKDFQSFFAAAAWTRQNLNCGLYVSAIYSAIIYRIDTNKLYIPPPYEILPNYFFMKESIVAGALLLSGKDVTSENIRNDGNSYIINVNYTTDIDDDTTSNVMAYFNEDIGLNTYLFLRRLTFENLWQTEGLNQLDVAEQIYHFMKQLSTRYELERYSNNIFDSMDLDWTKPISDNYEPMLMYSNGKEFSGRSREMDVTNAEFIGFLKNIESSVTSIVSRMVQNNFTKKDILKTLIETLVTGENSYETIAFRNIGKTFGDDGSPSSLEHYMTLARDPMFWKVNSKIVSIIENVLNILPTYTRNELYFPGVQVNNADIKKFATSFDNFVIDTTEALKPLESDATFQVKLEQPRLNHKPFAIKFNISSVVSQKGLIKAFLAPKLMPGELAKSKSQFMLLDSFETSFKKGANSITRLSTEMKSFSDDFLSLKTLEKYVEDAEFGLDTLSFESSKKFTGFPSRLAIPKGSEDGLPFQLFVFVAPLSKVIILDAFSKRIEFNNASLSPGYPLDLFVNDDTVFDLPNSLVKEIVITFKKPGSGKSGEYKKPYNKPSNDGYDNWETKKPILRSTGFSNKIESTKKYKGLLNDKKKSDITKIPVKIEDDPSIIDITKNPLSANKVPSYFDKNTKSNKNVVVDFDSSGKIFGKNKVINIPFDGMNKNVEEFKEIGKEDNSYYNNEIIKSFQLDTDNYLNKNYEGIPKEKIEKKSKDMKIDKKTKFDSKVNKDIKGDTDNFLFMNDEIIPKSLVNNEITSNASKPIVINKSFADTYKNIKDSMEISKDIKEDGSKRFVINGIVSNKVKPAVEIDLGKDKSFIKTINKENDFQKSYDFVDQKPLSLLQLSGSKDIITNGDTSDVHKKIVINDQDVIDKNTDISIAKDDGTNVEIHRILDGPIFKLTSAYDRKNPLVYDYIIKTDAKDDNFNEYEVYE